MIISSNRVLVQKIIRHGFVMPDYECFTLAALGVKGPYFLAGFFAAGFAASALG